MVLAAYIPKQADVKAYYKLEDVNDSGSGGYNLTNRGTVTFAAGKTGNAAILGASNTTKYLDIANDLGLNTYQAGIFTISCWVYCETNPGAGASLAIWGVVDSAKEQVNFDYMNDGGTYKLGYTIWNGSSAEILKWTVTLSLNTWTHLLLEKNGTTLTAMVNNASLGTNTITLADNAAGRSDQFCIGRYAYDAAPFWKGNIDETIIWTTTLTAAEKTQVYNMLAPSGAFFMFF